MNHLLIACAFFLTFAVVARAADEPAVVDVWPTKAPGETRAEQPEKSETSGKVTRVTNVFKPTLTIYHPAKDKDNGAAVVICPGGGYSILAWDLEGVEVAQWLNSVGVTGIILKYRVPVRKAGDMDNFMALMDAQRAISLSRSKAKEWGIDPQRIGILGFSAGGHLSALACTHFDKRSYDAIDDADKESCRPDFGVLIYPAYLANDKTQELSPEFHITAKTPQIFIAGAGDDRVTNVGSPVFFLALKKAGVSAEMHLYAVGGHGFGLRPSAHPCSTWPARCEEWMKSQGLLKPAAGK
ncbi:MAG TPA: alpha/beta hydrolase [Tepidisphaeraceae bacterium]|jgi:acetyl esterase/lipase|nr:alpha/beta hydrolase [Tepidisphaeraceae bacterium]